MAAQRGDLPRLRQLLAAAPALATATNRDGRTALSHAAEAGEEGAVRLLLEAGPEAALLQDSLGRTPLFWAASFWRREAVLLLLEAAPGAAEVASAAREPFVGRLPLHRLAVWADEALMCHALAAAPAAAYETCREGCPLHLAAAHANPGRGECVAGGGASSGWEGCQH